MNNYVFKNKLSKEVKKLNSAIKYTYKGKRTFRITLNRTDRNYWVLNMTIDSVQKTMKTHLINGVLIQPNQYNSTEERLYWFELIIDNLITSYIDGSIVNLVESRKKDQNKVYTINEVINSYLDFCSIKQCSLSTLETYKCSLKKLSLRYGKLTINEFNRLSQKEIFTFIYSLNLKPTSLSLYLKTYGILINFLNKNKQDFNVDFVVNNHFTEIKIELPKKVFSIELDDEDYKHKAFTDNDLHLVMDCAANIKKNQFLHLCLLIIFDSHLRPNEIRQIQIKNINFETKYITLEAKKMKTKTSRISYVSDTIIEFIQRVIDKQKIDITTKENKELYLFGTCGKWLYSTPIAEQYFQQHFRNYIRKPLGLNDQYSVYSMKHYANIYKYRQGFSLVQLMQLNGHSKISTTEIYLSQITNYVDPSKSLIDLPTSPILPPIPINSNIIPFTPKQAIKQELINLI